MDWWYVPRRYVMVTLTCIGMLIVHAMRVNVAVTVVTILDQAPHRKVGTIEAIASLPNVSWDARMIGFLHAVFYLGYIITQIPGGYLAHHVASHRLFGGCILLSCVLNLLLPVCILRFGYVMTCVVRGLQGLSEGLLFPSSYAIMRHWTTPHERSRMGAIVLTGVYIGPVLGLPVAGYLTHYFGWQYVYYANGGAGILWFLFWLFLSYERPADHPTIKPEELKLIQDSQGETAIIYEHDTVPWSAIFTSMPVWALNVCNFARSFIFFLLLTNEPAYLNVFGFTIAENGLFSSLPHIIMASTAALSGPAADYLMKDPMLTPTSVRKMFTCLGFGVESVCCFLLGFLVSGVPAIIFLTIGVGLSGFTISGWQINHLDIAPRYASVLVGLTTAAGTVAGIINPLIVGALTVNQTVDEWQKVFFLTSGVLMFAVIFYGIFGSGVKQSWAEPRPEMALLVKGPKSGTPTYTVVPGQISADALKQSLNPFKGDVGGPTDTDTTPVQKPSITGPPADGLSDNVTNNDTDAEPHTNRENKNSVIPKTNSEPVQPDHK